MPERVRTILNAYLAASLAAGLAFVLGLLLIIFVGLLFEGRWQVAAAFAVSVFVFPLMLGGWVSFFVVVLALVPALIIIGIAEAARLRAAAFYGCAGTVTAVVCWSVLLRKSGEWFALPSPTLASTIEWAVPAAAGLIGGLVYWRLAGASAGDWHFPQKANP